MPAFFDERAARFIELSPDLIIGQLSQRTSDAGFFQQLSSQVDAWRAQITCIQCALAALANIRSVANWHVLLEYPIPRRAKRIDAVLLAAGVILVLEFKIGSKDFDRQSVVQVEDYCLDIRDFHKSSDGRSIVPVLVATGARQVTSIHDDNVDRVKPVWLSNSEALAETINTVLDRYSVDTESSIDGFEWNHSDYSPTPTIIESAQSLYAGKNVKEITQCHAGAANLTSTSETILKTAELARTYRKKLICFVTGVPGSGKTLAGLNIVHNRQLHDGDLGVFMSGNIPLVRVLRAALARDHSRRKKDSKSESRRKVSTFIQVVKDFIKAYIDEKGKVPVDRIVVFDEAQRAWNAEQSNRKFGHQFSEPEMMLEILDRHQDWAVLVALVGNGQEIHTGEAGLSEWGRAIEKRFSHWHVVVSPSLTDSKGFGAGALFPDGAASGISITKNQSLHLSVPLRSYKAEALSDFVTSLLANDSARCKVIAAKMRDYPMFLTRDLGAAKKWLRIRKRGSRRIGLVASSGARRLRAHGLDVRAELDVENWFLNSEDDVRSSYFLEVPATEFGIQGLELDWTGVCWGGDLVPNGKQWLWRSFMGTKWQIVRNEVKQQFIINKYRVLLTRAREGMVIWVPVGDESDSTRPQKHYDAIASYLVECGVCPFSP